MQTRGNEFTAISYHIQNTATMIRWIAHGKFHNHLFRRCISGTGVTLAPRSCSNSFFYSANTFLLSASSNKHRQHSTRITIHPTATPKWYANRLQSQMVVCPKVSLLPSVYPTERRHELQSIRHEKGRALAHKFLKNSLKNPRQMLNLNDYVLPMSHQNMTATPDFSKVSDTCAIDTPLVHTAWGASGLRQLPFTM